MGRLDEVRRELAQILDRLHELPDNSFAERSRLRSRQHALRAEAAALREELPQDRDALHTELRQLKRRLERIIEQRGNVAAGGYGGGTGGDSGSVAFFDRLARDVDRAQGRAEVEARIREVRRRLRALDET